MRELGLEEAPALLGLVWLRGGPLVAQILLLRSLHIMSFLRVTK